EDNYGASFSPDGRSVAFSSTKGGRPNIWTKDLDASYPAQITQTTSEDVSDLFPIWSPDGREIAFVSDRASAVGSWGVNAPGGEPRLLARLSEGIDLPLPRLVHWSRDGSAIYYERHRNLWYVDVASGGSTQITHFNPLNSRVRDFSISPEEDRGLYADSGEGLDGVWAFDLKQVLPSRVTGYTPAQLGPLWLRGGRIAYSAEKDDAYQVFITSRDGPGA